MQKYKRYLFPQKVSKQNVNLTYNRGCAFRFDTPPPTTKTLFFAVYNVIIILEILLILSRRVTKDSLDMIFQNMMSGFPHRTMSMTTYFVKSYVRMPN